MKASALPYDILLATDDEIAVLEWWLARRAPEWSVALHIARCGGDDQDYGLMHSELHLEFGCPICMPWLGHPAKFALIEHQSRWKVPGKATFGQLLREALRGRTH